MGYRNRQNYLFVRTYPQTCPKFWGEMGCPFVHCLGSVRRPFSLPPPELARSLLSPRLVPSRVTCCHGGEAGVEAPPIAAPRPGAMDGAARPSTASRRLPSPTRALVPMDGAPRTSGLLLSMPAPPVASSRPSRTGRLAEKLPICCCPRRCRPLPPRALAAMAGVPRSSALALAHASAAVAGKKTSIDFAVVYLF